MLPSSDSRRRQRRVPVKHSSGRDPSRFHADAVVTRSPLHLKSKSSEPQQVTTEGTSGRGTLKTCLAKLKIRNFFFVIIGCASMLLIGWVHISADNVIPRSEMDQHPVKSKTKSKRGTGSKATDNSGSRNLSSKQRFATLGNPVGDSSLLEDMPQTKLKRDRTNESDGLMEESDSPQQESGPRRLYPHNEQLPPRQELEQHEGENQRAESFQDWKKNKSRQRSDLQQQPRQQQRQLPDDNQQPSEDINLREPRLDDKQQPYYLPQLKQDGMQRRRTNRRSIPLDSALGQTHKEDDAENEGPDQMSPQEADEEESPQQQFPNRQGVRQNIRKRARNGAPNDHLDEIESPRPKRRKQASLKARPVVPEIPQNDESEEPLQQDEQPLKHRIRQGRYVSPQDAIEPDEIVQKSREQIDSPTLPTASEEEFSSSQTLTCPTLEQSPVDRIVYWKETKDSDYDIVSSYRQAGGRDAKYLTFELNSTNIQWNSRRRLLETMISLAFATGRTLVLPPKMTLVTTMEEMTKAGMSPWLGFQDLMTLPSAKFRGFSVISMDRFLELEGATGRLKTTPHKNQKAGTPLSPPNGYAHWDGAANMQDLWHYLQSVSYQPEGWDPLTCVLGIPSAVRKSSSTTQDEEGEDTVEQIVTVDSSSLVTWMENIWGRHHGRPPPDKLDYQGRPTRVDAPAVERLRELAAERRKVCHYGQELEHAKVLHLQGDQLEGYPFYSFVFFEDWKQDLFVKRLVRDHLRYNQDILCAAAKVVDHLEAADGNVPAHYHGIHLLLRDLIKGDAQQFEEDDLNVAMSLLVEDLKKWIQPGSRIYIATDMDEQRDCFQILRQSYHLVFISYIESLLEGRTQPVVYPMVEQLVLARAHTFVGSYPSTFSAYVNRLRGYYTTTEGQKSAGKVDFLQQAVEAQDGSLASYYLAPRQMQKQMRIYQSLRQPLGDLEYPVAWRDIDRA